MSFFGTSFNTRLVADYLSNLQLPYGDGNDAVLAYHQVFEKRYAKTLQIIDKLGLDRRVRVLELAAAPYGMTGLLRHYLFDNVTIAGFGALNEERRSIKLGVFANKYSFEEVLFNAEKDVWPFEDQCFDLIISCEMLEHLLFDPMHIFVEANRVLDKNGLLFLSTPNASSWQNLIKVISFDTPSLVPHFRLPSTLENVYQRHNREYTPGALSVMFDAAGFEMKLRSTDDSYPLHKYALSPLQFSSMQKLFGPGHMRGDTLNFVGKKTQGVKERYPTAEHLYHVSDVP